MVILLHDVISLFWQLKYIDFELRALIWISLHVFDPSHVITHCEFSEHWITAFVHDSDVQYTFKSQLSLWYRLLFGHCNVLLVHMDDSLHWMICLSAGNLYVAVFVTICKCSVIKTKKFRKIKIN